MPLIVVVVVASNKLLERVILTRCAKVTGIGVGYLLDNLPSLRELNVAGCTLVDDEMVEVDHEGERCLALQSVQVRKLVAHNCLSVFTDRKQIDLWLGQLSWTGLSLKGVFTLIAQARRSVFFLVLL